MNKQEIYKWLDNNIEICVRYVKKLQINVDNYDKLSQGYLNPLECQPKEYYIKLLDDYKYTLSIYQQIKTILEAWEDKETPKKPERFISKFHVSPPKCPVCKTIPHTCTQKYCDECGQKLDWSDEHNYA